MKKLFFIYFFGSIAFSQSSLDPQPGDENLAPIGVESPKGLPGDKAYPPLHERIKLSQEILKSESDKLKAPEPMSSVPTEPKPKNEARLTLASKVSEESPKAPEPDTKPKPVPTYSGKTEFRSTQPPSRDIYLPNSGITVFKDNFEEWEEEVIQVPALSTALATIQFGEEITMTEGDYVTAKLDYAFLGANGAIVELTGCLVDIDARANFNTTTVKGKLNKIVCTGPRGYQFTQKVEGKIISAAREYGGVKSDIIMAGPAKGIALEALQTAIKGFGEAMAFTETTRQAVAGEYSSREVENLSGNKDRYIGGKVLQSTGDFMQYLVDFYKGLEPSLALAPGVKIHVLIRDSLEVPTEFFKGKLSKRQIRGGSNL